MESIIEGAFLVSFFISLFLLGNGDNGKAMHVPNVLARLD